MTWMNLPCIANRSACAMVTQHRENTTDLMTTVGSINFLDFEVDYSVIDAGLLPG